MREPVTILGPSGPTRVATGEDDSSIKLRPAGFTAPIGTVTQIAHIHINPPQSHHIKVHKQKESIPPDIRKGEVVGVPEGIWVGKCQCGLKIQYWDFGATFGAMLYHQWKEGSK